MPDRDQPAANESEPDRSEEQPESDDTPEHTRSVVFISYRVDPDQPVADALKRLIESSIVPVPEAFVSGVGGLHSSRDAWKKQLQRVAQRARAFVGVISHASKEREWVYFEAGAAWGLNLPYAPLLIDTTPRDLTSTIADNLASRASDSGEVERLIRDLATALGGTVKMHFAKRYQAFAKALERYQARDAPVSPAEEPVERSPRGQALRLAYLGKREEAAIAYAKLEEDAASEEERASIRFEHIFASPGDEAGQILERIESLEERFKSSSHYALWIGILESRPALAIAALERCIQLTKVGTIQYHQATLALAERHAALSQKSEALTVLASAVRSGDRPLSVAAVATWIELFKNVPDEAKLVLLRIARVVEMRAEERPKLMAMATNLALEAPWPALLARYATTLAEDDDSPSSSHTLGRASQILGLPSLAHRAYSKADKGGITVAKAALADLLRASGVAAAGLEILEGYTGRFDAASPSYPYHVRARIEDVIEAEEMRMKRLTTLGRAVDVQLAALADLALRDSGSVELLSTAEEVVRLKIEAGRPPVLGLSAALGGKEPRALDFQRALDHFNIWIVREGGKVVAMVHADANGAVEGFLSDLSSSEPSIVLIKGAPATSLDKDLASGATDEAQ